MPTTIVKEVLFEDRASYEALINRYTEFIQRTGDPNSEVINVFTPLLQKQVQELELIREVSKELQKHKAEDILKAKQAAAEAELAAKAREEEEKAKQLEEEKNAETTEEAK